MKNKHLGTITLTVLPILALAVAALTSAPKNDKAEKAAAASTTTTFVVDFSGYDWVAATAWIGVRIINSAGTAVYGGGLAADSTTDSEYSWPGAGTDKKFTLTVTDMVAGTTGFQFIATTAATTGGNRTAYVTCDVVAGGSYTCTIGSWNSTNSNYNLTVVSSSSVEDVTLKFTTSYLLDSNYFSYRISYTDDGGSSYLNVTPTTDGTLASGVYTYTATITSATIGVLLQWSVYIVEVIPVANTTDPAWVGTASGLSFTPTADLTSMTAGLSANTVIYGAYNLGLATDWAKTFLLAFMNDGSATF